MVTNQPSQLQGESNPALLMVHEKQQLNDDGVEVYRQHRTMAI
jgi:hypothetical protein